MSTTLGQRATNVPLPTGMGQPKFGGTGGTQLAYPGAENFLLPGDGSNGEIGPFASTERFWLHVGANVIIKVDAAWSRYDYALRLLPNYAGYSPDLLGNLYYQKAHSGENHAANGWSGCSIDGMFYCEANTSYWVRLLSFSNTPAAYYYQHQVHYNMWGYTIGEGAY